MAKIGVINWEPVEGDTKNWSMLEIEVQVSAPVNNFRIDYFKLMEFLEREDEPVSNTA